MGRDQFSERIPSHSSNEQRRIELLETPNRSSEVNRMYANQYVLEEVTDLEDVARFRAQDKRHKRNLEWLAAHWADLLPDARGKFVAVAGEEAFVADTPAAAWAWAQAAHPEDDGAFCQFVPKEGCPRIYDSHGHMANLR
jgi:hypothetical protein